jgi:hypothetical protein
VFLKNKECFVPIKSLEEIISLNFKQQDISAQFSIFSCCFLYISEQLPLEIKYAGSQYEIDLYDVHP